MSQADRFSSISAMGDRVSHVAAWQIVPAFRRVLRGSSDAGEQRFVRFITGEPHPFGNLAVVADPSDLEGLTEAIRPLLDCGAPAAAILPGMVPESVDKRLAEHGFACHERMPAMAVDIDAMTPAELPDGYTFARVGTGAEGDEWGAVFATGYELPPKIGEAFSPNATKAPSEANADVQFFAIRKGDRMVCTSMVYLGMGVAGIYCVATLPDERGRGLGAYATAEPLRIARAMGYGVGVLQSSAAGYSVYKKLGFADFAEVPLYVRMPE